MGRVVLSPCSSPKECETSPFFSSRSSCTLSGSIATKAFGRENNFLNQLGKTHFFFFQERQYVSLVNVYLMKKKNLSFMLFGKEKIKAEPCKVLKKRNMLWLTSVSVLAKKKKQGSSGKPFCCYYMHVLTNNLLHIDFVFLYMFSELKHLYF